MDDGTRTHDDRHHKPGLYQLSYAHHGILIVSRLAPLRQVKSTGLPLNWRARQDSNLQPSA